MPVWPLCTQHTPRSLRLLKIQCPLLIKRRPNGWWHGGSQTISDDADRFYIVLFSALEQTHCAFVACDSI